jgi:hypothetical protein
MGSSGRLALGGEFNVNDMVNPRSVRGVEIYPSIDEVPDEVRRGLRWQDVDRCGIVWIWTAMGW